jgi:hypothetical protein
MNRIPTWLPAAHLFSAVLEWALCISLGLAFGAHVGWISFAVIEFRVFMALRAQRAYVVRRGGVA